MSLKLNAGPQVCVMSVCFQVPVLGLSPPYSVPWPQPYGCRGPVLSWLDQAIAERAGPVLSKGAAQTLSFGDYSSNSNRYE